MISSSVLIAAFALVHRSQLRQQRRRPHGGRGRHATRAFLGPEPIRSTKNCGGRHRPIELRAAPPSAEGDHGGGGAEGAASQSSSPAPSSSSSTSSSSSPSSSSSSESKRLGPAPESEDDGESSPDAKGGEDASDARAVVATKRATATRFSGGAKRSDPRGGDDAAEPSATEDANDDSSSPRIRGPTPAAESSFDRLRRVHCTLAMLRKHLPSLLDLPAAPPATARWIYDRDVSATGPKGERLAAGSDEVLLLRRALAAAATAARRAGSLFDLVAGGSASSSSSSSGGRLECELLVDPDDPLRALALWRTRLPSIGMPSAGGGGGRSPSYTEFSGRSTVRFSPDSGLVSELQINEVKINGVAIIESLETALATVRRAARSAGAMVTSSVAGASGKDRSGGNPLLDGILSGIQDVVDAVDALDPPSEGREGGPDSPLYVVPESLWEGAAIPVEGGIPRNATPTGLGDDAAANADGGDEPTGESPRYIPVPIDDYSEGGGGRTTPPVGSVRFVEYAARRDALRGFAERGLRQLAGAPPADDAGDDGVAVVSTEAVRSLFATDAELVTFGTGTGGEGVVLLRGAGKVADLYRSLALFREAAGGDWSVRSLEADAECRGLVVRWATESPIRIEGADRFVFEAPRSSGRRLPSIEDGDEGEVAARCASYFGGNDDSAPSRISRIENLGLTVAGAAPDSAWAKSFVSAALRSGVTENAPLVPDATITELLRALTTTKKKTPARGESTRKAEGTRRKRKGPSMPALDGAASANFYGILRALHEDLPELAGRPGGTTAGRTPPSSSSATGAVPAGDFLAETVELRGLLGEVLARGSGNYRRLLGLAASSLRAAVRARTVSLAAAPRPTLEVTPRGTIAARLILALWVSAPSLGGGGGGAGRRRGDDDDDEGFGVPLRIEVSSEYVVDDAGMIREHRILESRLNGVLTPGDVLSRWIRGLAGGEGGGQDGGGGAAAAVPSAMGSLMDAVAWVRSMQDRK